MSDRYCLEAFKKMDGPVTKSLIIDKVQELGITESDTVLVHTSLSSFGFVCGGAQTIVEALIALVGKEGTIVMPSQSGDNSNPENWGNPPVPKEWIDIIKQEMPAYNKRLTPTRGVGKVVECLLSHPNSIRSSHPVISFVAHGKTAETLMANHTLEYALGEGSPLQKLYECDAKILFLGTNYETATALHLSEYKSNVREDVLEECAIINSMGEREWISYKDIALDSDIFSVIGDKFEKEHKVPTTKIGLAECRVIDLKCLVDFGTTYFENKNDEHIEEVISQYI